MSIPTKFIPSEVEEKWYNYWLENSFFKSTPDSRKPYTIVIPPPNVTGVLHMGHMLNNSLQDILIRRARMKGYNACWVPGTDHASIATEAKVVEKLKKKGFSKNDLTREEFLKHAWEWTDEFGGVILEQLKKIGCSCDWDRTKFTLDPEMSKSVINGFIDLHNRGLIYRGYRMVNWDPQAQTTLSDEEVIYKEKPGSLYYISYKIYDSDDSVVVATTRPETILGDTAICINPKDKRYKHLHGKKVIVPIAKRSIPIILDEYVDVEFGTGCLKVTPAHDPNDKILGEKHKLDFIDVLNPNGTLNSKGLHYEGKDRFIVRKSIIKEIDNLGQLVKKENHISKVGTSERTSAIIEPRISEQWFLKMKSLAEPAKLSVLKSEEVQLIPEKFKNTYSHWMENITDWNISRQLWWGHRIPVYYYGKKSSNYVVAESIERALELAKIKFKNNEISVSDLNQDDDVLDTWFSSWLWPISVFNGINEPDNDEINYYYPTQDLVTGPDILFFWVARMIMAGYAFRDNFPFSKVYLTGIVRDKKGKKMSKQLGNSPDALALIDEHGADAVRVGLMLSSAAGNDLLFDEKLCIQGKNFANKIWNAYRLIDSWNIDSKIKQPSSSRDALICFENTFNKDLESINGHFDKYRISDALMTAYKLVWDDFCSWLLETVKPDFGSSIDIITFDQIKLQFQNILKLIHPFMPFISEEIWHIIKVRSKPEESLIVSSWPKAKKYDKSILESYETMKQTIGALRKFRKENDLPQKFKLNLICHKKNSVIFPEIISRLGQLDKIEFSDKKINQNGGVLNVGTNEFFIPLDIKIDFEKELIKINEEIKYLEKFRLSINKKLSNPSFVENAPNKIIEFEKKKLSDTEQKIKNLKNRLKKSV
ncbi:MAG: valine--tRNA ligase [Flavobacteriales bacterium]|nr:valine--tRNA ligase [Flavobacteriales bacterium]